MAYNKQNTMKTVHLLYFIWSIDMKKALIISFNVKRPGEVQDSYAVGSIVSYCKQFKEFGNEFDIEAISVDAQFR